MARPRHRYALPGRLRQMPLGDFRQHAATGPHASQHRATGMARHDGRGQRDRDGADEMRGIFYPGRRVIDLQPEAPPMIQGRSAEGLKRRG